MGEFKVSYSNILRNDVKHIYSGFPRWSTGRVLYPTMEQLRIRTANANQKTKVLQFSEFNREYSCLLPRAPAFRRYSRHQVEEVVERLIEKREDAEGRSRRKAKEEQMEELKSKETKIGPEFVSKRQMTMIIERLKKPTQIAEIRKKQTKEHKTNDHTTKGHMTKVAT